MRGLKAGGYAAGASGIIGALAAWFSGDGSLASLLTALGLSGGGIIAAIVAFLSDDKKPDEPVDPNVPVDPTKIGIKDVLSLIASVMKDGKFTVEDAVLIFNFIISWLKQNDPKTLSHLMQAQGFAAAPPVMSLQNERLQSVASEMLNPKDAERKKLRDVVNQVMSVDVVSDALLDHGGIVYFSGEMVAKDGTEFPASFGRDPRVKPVAPTK